MIKLLVLTSLFTLFGAFLAAAWWHERHRDDIDGNSVFGILMEKAFGDGDGDGDGGGD